MTEVTLTPAGAVALDGRAPVRPRLDSGFDGRSSILFCGLLAFGLFFIAYSLYEDVRTSGAQTTTWLPFVLLGVALFIALGFEFVNGFHDTANAVATVIYTHSLSAPVAVVWSGAFNFRPAGSTWSSRTFVSLLPSTPKRAINLH
jgi:inorganic phosphate transporter, PiT family